MHLGPCEHGVKYRSKCKVCSACPHGRRRLKCKECVVGARSVVGVQSASTVVSAMSARSAVVHQSASTVVGALSARSAVVHQSASTVVGAHSARSAVGKECGARRWCEHGRQRSKCKSASTALWMSCEHGRLRALRARSSAQMQGVRWVIKSASTVVSALDARTVEAINNITHSALVQALTPFPRNIQSSSSLSSPPFAAAAVGTALLGADRTDGACENRSSSLSSE